MLSSSMLIFLLLLATLQLIYGSCPSGFDLAREGQCRGLHSRGSLTWNQAADTATSRCKDFPGGLPTYIRNSEQNTYWSKRVDPTRTVQFVLPLKCDSATRLWLWTDGTRDSYTAPVHCDELNYSCKDGWTTDLRPDGSWTCGYSHHDLTADIGCTTQLHQPVRNADGCESFEDDSDDGVCYKIVKTAENWQEAQLICRSFGADVASIHNLQENSYLRRLAVSKGAVSGMYLGATVSGKTNDFGWTDGSEMDYDNFYPGFPMTGLGDCIIMDTGGTSGQWANVDCSSKLSVACMRQQNYTVPACSSGPFQEGQIIYSPGFPFDASTPCDFILSVDTGKMVEMKILVLEANSCCDHLVVYENYFGGNIMANLTGEVSGKTYTTKSSNFMRVSWQPNGGVNVRGMMMTFRGV